MANCNPPVKNQAFDLGFSLYKTDGSVIANPGTLTAKISKDYGDYADIGTVTEEDTTYGQLKAALTATEMNADVVMVYIKDDTSGCVPFTATIYTVAAVWAGVGAAMTLADDAITSAKFDETTAYPLTSADTGATAVARTGGDSDTLEVLSDEIAAVATTVGVAGAGLTAITGAKLHSDYDAAKTAAAAGAKMDLVDAPNATALAAIKDAVQGVGTTLATLLSRIVGTLATGTHSPQSGDAYARIGAAGASLSAVPWNAAWDAEVQSECTDALNAYDPPTKTEMDSAIAGGDDAVLARLGTPAGASVSADLADIEGKVDDLEDRLTATRAGYLDNLATAPPTAAQIKTAIEAAGGSIAAILEDTGTTLDTLVKDIPTNSELTTALASADDAVLAAITAAHSTTDGKLDTIDNFLDTEIAAILADTTLLESLGAAVADILADTSELQADWHDGGRLDLILDAVGGTDVTDILDWILNKMVRTDNGDGTITYVLYADDNTTPKWTWVYTTETGVRAKAT